MMRATFAGKDTADILGKGERRHGASSREAGGKPKRHKNKVGLRMALDMLPEAAWTDVFGHPTLRISKAIRFCAGCMELKYSPSVCWEDLEENETDRKKLRCGWAHT